MKKIVSIEITSEYIRGVEVSKPFDKGAKVIHVAEYELPQGVAADSEIIDHEEMVEAFKKFWKEERFGTKDVILALGGRKIFVRNYETPIADMKKIQARLKYEASALLPSNAGDDAIVDFYPSGIEELESGEVNIQGLLVASSVSPVENILSVMKEAGLHVVTVDFAPFGVARAARKAYGTQGDYLIVHIRAYTTEIIALKSGTPQLVRTLPNGIAVREKKEGRHRDTGSPDVSFAGDAESTSDPIDVIIGGIKNTLTFYEGKGGLPIAILLAGEGSTSVNATQRLAEDLPVPVGLFEIEKLVDLPRKFGSASPIEKAASLSTISAGLRGL